MRITVVAFATAADALGAPEREMEVPAGTRVDDLRRLLEADHPDLAPLWPRLAVAVDGEIARSEEEITDGAEVALLPPVSGGRPNSLEPGPNSLEPGPDSLEPGLDTREPATTEPLAELTQDPIDVGRITAAVSGPTRGAVLLFLGTVRDSHQGRQVEQLTYSAYRPMAETRLRRIVQDLQAEADDLRAAIIHRLGNVPVGEPSVAIAVASPHRAAAYEASRKALERLKAEVPIWKQEHYEGGEVVWREEEPLGEA